MVWFALYTTHYEPECLNNIWRTKCNDIHVKPPKTEKAQFNVTWSLSDHLPEAPDIIVEVDKNGLLLPSRKYSKITIIKHFIRNTNPNKIIAYYRLLCDNFQKEQILGLSVGFNMHYRYMYYAIYRYLVYFGITEKPRDRHIINDIKESVGVFMRGVDLYLSSIERDPDHAEPIEFHFYGDYRDDLRINSVVTDDKGNLTVNSYTWPILSNMTKYGPRGIKMFLKTFAEPDVYKSVSYKKIK